MADQNRADRIEDAIITNNEVKAERVPEGELGAYMRGPLGKDGKPEETEEETKARMRAEAARPVGSTILGGDLRSLAAHQTPRAIIGKIRAEGRTRPNALPENPRRKNVAAFTPTPVIDRWNHEAAGIRAVEMGDNVITMFGAIGEDFWSEGVTAKSVTRQLRAIGGRAVEVHINSPGGDMFEGISIYNVLREHPYPVNIKVMGLAASAASIISMAADELMIGAASFLMIHNCSVFAGGNRHDFAEIAEFLAPFDAAMVDLYAQRTGQEAKAITKWMDEEAWMSGSTAIARGFADTMLSAEKVKSDPEEKVKDVEINEVRALEMSLITSGMSRGDARARIQKLKGTPGAANEPDGTPGAAITPNEDWSGFPDLLAAFN